MGIPESRRPFAIGWIFALISLSPAVHGDLLWWVIPSHPIVKRLLMYFYPKCRNTLYRCN